MGISSFPVQKQKPVATEQTLNAQTNANIQAALNSVDSEEVVTSADDLTSPAGSGKSQLIALILVIAVGGLGIHRFYLGYIWQGVVQLLTAGGCGIWWIIDLIRIITGDLQPKDGSYSQTL
ncbi:MAG: TM2 domain-containing protein [Saprospiraceae bacterium]|nr:TM2 domain-containing protein [Saprospiraceae bacterium]